MGFNQKIPTPQETAIASYTFNELITKRSYLKLYFCGGLGLTENEYYATSIETTHNEVPTTSYSEWFATTWDTAPMGSSIVFNGQAVMEMSVVLDDLVTSPDAYIDIIVYKVVDAVETQIETATLTYNNFSPGLVNHLQTFDFDNVRFNKDDILRIKVNAYARADSGSGAIWISFGTDPLNRDGTNVTPSTQDSITKTAIYMPVRVDI